MAMRPGSAPGVAAALAAVAALGCGLACESPSAPPRGPSECVGITATDSVAATLAAHRAQWDARHDEE